MFAIDWEDIKEQGLSATWEAPVAEFELLEALEKQGVCRFSSPVRAEIEARWISGMLDVRGEVCCQAVIACSRCLKEFDQALDGHFNLTFVQQMPEISVTEDEEGEGYELAPDEMGLIHAPEESIDLHDTLAEQLLLSLPVRPLCDTGCAGLCPRCGQNLNQARCHCEKENFNNKFAALKNLKFDKE